MTHGHSPSRQRWPLRAHLTWLVIVALATLAGVHRGYEHGAAAQAADRAWQGKSAPPLPAPSGRIVRVATSGALHAAVAAMTSGTTVLLAPGLYRLRSTLAMANARRVAIRGATGRAGDVVIEGPGLDAPAGTALLDASGRPTCTA